MGRRQWKQALDAIREELGDLGPRMEREGRSAEDRLERIENGLTKALEDLDERTRSATASAEHALELFQELMARDDSGSSTGF